MLGCSVASDETPITELVRMMSELSRTVSHKCMPYTVFGIVFLYVIGARSDKGVGFQANWGTFCLS